MDARSAGAPVSSSGNGVQCLWKLAEPIKLSSNAEPIIADVEARTAAVMLRLGGKPGTQNIDRILRLPGTTNLPNKKKRKEGRVVCETKLIQFNGASYSLDAFPPPEENKPGTPDDGGHHARQGQRRVTVNVDDLPVSDRIKNLIRGIDDPDHPYPSRSERVMAVLTAMVSADCTDEEMTAIMLDRQLPIGEHVREQSKTFAYLSRQIKHAREKAAPGQRIEVKIKATLDDILKNAADLRTKTFEQLRMIIPNYLPEGLSVLGGKPKIGKSWLALDAADAVASGGNCLGQQCEQGDVLALMLEDTDRRLQRRLTKMLGAQRHEWPNRLTYATGWPRLNDGGLDWMREWIDRASKPRLIIVDILERIRQRISSKDRAPQYSADYDALAALQELSAEAQLSILVLHHQRKLGAHDLIDTLSGTLGLGGAVDAVLILGKDPQLGKFLYGRGRDLEEFDIAVQQDEKCRWQVLGPRFDEQASPERAKIIAVLAKAGRPMNVKDISEEVGSKTENVKNLLTKLYAEGQVERVSWGWYRLPKEQGDIPF
jgi:AAA domain